MGTIYIKNINALSLEIWLKLPSICVFKSQDVGANKRNSFAFYTEKVAQYESNENKDKNS